MFVWISNVRGFQRLSHDSNSEFHSASTTTCSYVYRYAIRLQVNLAWLASSADSRQGVRFPMLLNFATTSILSQNHSSTALPMMDPPPPVEFTSMDRIHQIYAELPSIFAKEIARRRTHNIVPTPAPSMSMSPLPPTSNINPNLNPNLKRDREELPTELSMAMKRRNTGESKGMMPPPSMPHTPNAHPQTQFNQLPMSMSSGGSGGIVPAHHASPRLAELNPAHPSLGMMNTTEAQLAASSRDRARQAQIQAAQQAQRPRMSPPGMAGAHMSPAMGSAALPQPMQQGGRQMINSGNAAAGPSNLGVGNPVAATNTNALLQVLQTPNHPFLQYMIKMVPGFQGFPPAVQMQKMMQAQVRRFL